MSRTRLKTLDQMVSYQPIKFNVPGHPVGKQRARIANGHGYTPLSTRDFEARVGQYAAIALQGQDLPYFPRGIYVKLDVRVYYMKSKGGQHPDLSNVIKSIEDGMNKIAYNDDKQIVCLTASMAFAANEENEVCAVCITPMRSIQGPVLIPWTPF